MKIALMMENSQASKNATIHHELKAVADEKGFPVYNVGMSDENDHHLTYIHLGIMASILLNSKAVDFVVTGCGTGQGAMMSLNIHPGVVCGYCLDPADAFLFAQINNGNALSLAFAKGYGWGAELNVRYMFEKAFTGRNGEGYPPERKEPQVRNAGILNQVKAAVVKENYLDTLRAIDPALVKTAVSGQRFQECFFENCQNKEIEAFVREVLASARRSTDKKKPTRCVGFLLVRSTAHRTLQPDPSRMGYCFTFFDTELPASRVKCSVSIIPTRQISAIKMNAKRKLMPGTSLRLSIALTFSPKRIPIAPSVMPRPIASWLAVLNNVLA